MAGDSEEMNVTKYSYKRAKLSGDMEEHEVAKIK
jgi:hypothetical protein